MIGISSPFIHSQINSKNCPVNEHNFSTGLDRSYPQYLGTGVNIVNKLLAVPKIFFIYSS
ncbi:MAG: hypothetical protein ACI9O6_003373 [Glaciecola sp.]|jgi:hypothetical protein